MPPCHDKIETALDLLETIFQDHQCIVLWGSSGKDSTALLHLMQPWRERVTIIHNQVDGGWPGSTENLLTLAVSWGFKPPILTQPVLTFDEYVAQFGYQAEVIPTEYDTLVQPPSPFQSGSVRVSSWWHCTLLRQILPLAQATLTLGADAVLTGSRASDAPGFAAMGEWTDAGQDLLGFIRYNPLTHWTTSEVYAYIDEKNIPLPPHYQWKRAAGDRYEFPDCLRCTWQPEHWTLLKEQYPEVYAEHWPETKHVYEALASQQWEYTKRLMKVIINHA